ncbi:MULTISPECIES: HNH endonuclease signature motif containing protein [unclassified Pseudomonas]|uniref:HNH endonuclease n=1 Tax=unclassified Pseudomonas TaxID=196821 RepID=UPI0013575293|nr:HNH endonuclease signature motif containing protein [Pseudomonas sp. 18058]
MDTSKEKSGWSDEELEASVDAYLKMLVLELQNQPFNKADENRLLRKGPLIRRSSSSVEYRMQNISAVMDQLGLPRITGYVSAKNLGSGVITRIKEILAKKDTDAIRHISPRRTPLTEFRFIEPTAPELNDAPAGVLNPKQTNATVVRLSRKLNVKKWVLKRSKGMCEGCGQKAPFQDADGKPFLEVHHVKHLVNGGTDRTSNAVALCPNCHRRCHYSSDKDEFTAEFYKRVAGLETE